MRTRSASLTLFALTLTLALAAARASLAEPSIPHEATIAQADSTAPEGAAPPDNQTVTNPNANKPVTAAEVAECMKTWDPQTGMSKDEYEKSCKSTLKYFPEKP